MEVAENIIDKRHVKILNMLARVAKDRDPEGRISHAACVVYKNEIISIGWNEYKKSHPLQAKFSPRPDAIFLHAEVSAISKSLNHLTVDELKKSTLYVARVMADGTWGMSQPCAGCAQAIAAFSIKQTVFTIGDNSYKVV